MRRRNPARWRAIEGRLSREDNIWFATTRFDGRPHLTPMWFVWFDNKIYICTGSNTQKFTNMRHNQNVSLALADPVKVVLIEGEAHVAPRQVVDTLANHFYHKYEWDFRYDDSTDWRLIEITPYKILAWGDGYEAEGTRVL